MRGEHLPFEVETGRVLTDRAAVDAQNRRQLDSIPRRRVGRAREIRVDHRAVGALRLEALDRSERDLREKRVVHVRELLRIGDRAIHQEYLARLLETALEDRNVAGLCHVEGVDVVLAIEDAVHLSRGGAAADRYAGEMDVAAFFEHEQHVRPTGVNCGRETLRSRPAVRIFGAPPSTGTSAMLFIAYQMSFGSPPCV